MLVRSDQAAREDPRCSPPGWGPEALERLLHPMAARTFVERVWEREPCVVSGRAADYYSNLLTMAAVDAIISTANPQSLKPSLALVRSDGSRDVWGSVPRTPQGIPDLPLIYRSYHEGYSIVIDSLQQRWQPVSQLCAALQGRLHHPVSASLCLTPRGAEPFAPRWDGDDMWVLQIEGAKLWQVCEPVVSLPLASMRGEAQASELGQPLQTVYLDSGDLLYIPRGYIYQTFASDASSLHLAVRVHPILWADLLDNALLLAATRDITLREALPAGVFQSESMPCAIDERFQQLFQRGLNGASIDDAIRPLSRRYADAQQVPMDGHFSSLNGAEQIDLDTSVSRREGILCIVSRTNSHAIVDFSGIRIQGPLSIEPALHFIASVEQFLVRDLPDCLTNNEKCVLVRRMVREGAVAVNEKS